MIRLRILWGLFLFALFFSACTPYQTSTKKRADRAKKAKGDIIIGIVWSTSVYKDLFIEGVTMAVDEINERGGVLRRRIRTIIYDDKASIRKGQKVANKIAKNYDIVAVVGHTGSDIAVPVSIIYQYNGIVFISPAATSKALTTHGFDFVFRNIPSDEKIGRQLARCAHRQGFRKMVILDDRTRYAQGLAYTFDKEAVELGVEIVFRRSYGSWWKEFRPLISEVKEMEFDAIFLAGQLPLAAEVMKQTREMGVTAPFIGGDSLDSAELWSLSGGAAQGTIVPTIFNPHQTDILTQQFNKEFYSRYQAYPDTWAAQGYDAIKLLAFVFDQCGSTVPIVVSSTLRFAKDWHGVAGTCSFTENGDIIGKSIYFKALYNGKFEYLKE